MLFVLQPPPLPNGTARYPHPTLSVLRPLPEYFNNLRRYFTRSATDHFEELPPPRVIPPTTIPIIPYPSVTKLRLTCARVNHVPTAQRETTPPTRLFNAKKPAVTRTRCLRPWENYGPPSRATGAHHDRCKFKPIIRKMEKTVVPRPIRTKPVTPIDDFFKTAAARARVSPYVIRPSQGVSCLALPNMLTLYVIRPT